MLPSPLTLRRLAAALALGLAPGWVLAQKAVRTPKLVLPPAISKALVRAQVPPDAVTLLVLDASGRQPPRLEHRSTVPMNPASVMKLVTTYAALDVLGPDYTWNTRLTLDGGLSNGILHGTWWCAAAVTPSWWSSGCRRCWGRCRPAA